MTQLTKPILIVLVAMLLLTSGIGYIGMARVQASATTVDFFLHGNSNLFLDTSSPTATTAKYVDSASIKFSGGNPWTVVGTWTSPLLAVSLAADGRLKAASPLDVWLGLKNSDDQGTNFDLLAELYKNGILVASGETHLIKGVTRNPDKAMKVTVSFGSFSPVDFDGTTDILSLKIFTRIGTNGIGGFGGGHSNAVGLRLYFDAISRPAKFDVTFVPLYLLTVNSAYDTPGGGGWYESGDTAHATLTDGTVSGGTGIQFVFTGWSVDATGTGLTSDDILMDGPKTATANWKTQYQVSFAQTGSAVAPTVTYTANTDPTTAVPFDVWVLAGSEISYAYQDPVPGASGVQYVLTGVDPASPQTVNGPLTITGTYKTQFKLTVASDHDSPSPAAGDHWYDSDSPITAFVTSPDVSDGTRYVCTGWTGTGSVDASGSGITTSFNIGAPSTITWNWKTQYQVSFAQTGSAVAPTVTYTANTDPTTAVPFDVWVLAGSEISYAYQDPVPGASGVQYVLTGVDPASPQTVNGPLTITGTYNEVLLGQELTALSPAKIWLGVVNSDNNGRHIDLKVEVYKNGVLVGTGEVLNVQVSGNALANSAEFNIALALVGSGVSFVSGDHLQCAVFVRRVGGSGDFGVNMWYDNSIGTGTHRGWSRFDATIGGTSNYYYYRSGAALNTNPGSSAVSSTLTATTVYQSFGTWSITLP